MLKHHSRFLKVELTDLLDVIVVRLYKHIRLQLISALCAFSENRGYVQCVFSPSNLQLSTETDRHIHENCILTLHSHRPSVARL